MASINLLFKVGIGILMICSLIELAFISSMVYWLNHGAGGPYLVESAGSVFLLHSTPLNLLTNQGHTSNGAAGTAFVLIGFGGILALFLRGSHKLFTAWYQLWLILTVPATLLTFAALIYVNVVTNAHAGQTIDVSVAAGLGGQPYPLDTWTPQNWFSAVLQLPRIGSDTASDISDHLRIMNGWRWNLIPLFIIQLAVCILAFFDALEWRRGRDKASKYSSGLLNGQHE